MKLSNKRIINDVLGKYYRALETPNHIYFINFEESDENRCVKMYDRKMNLVSNNHFAHSSLMEDLESGIYSWISSKLKENYKLMQKDLED